MIKWPQTYKWPHNSQVVRTQERRCLWTSLLLQLLKQRYQRFWNEDNDSSWKWPQLAPPYRGRESVSTPQQHGSWQRMTHFSTRKKRSTRSVESMNWLREGKDGQECREHSKNCALLLTSLSCTRLPQQRITGVRHRADSTKRPWIAEIKLPNVRSKNLIGSIHTRVEQVAQAYNATAIYFGKSNKSSPCKCKDLLGSHCIEVLWKLNQEGPS